MAGYILLLLCTETLREQIIPFSEMKKLDGGVVGSTREREKERERENKLTPEG
jgi:hypothetical protein